MRVYLHNIWCFNLFCFSLILRIVCSDLVWRLSCLFCSAFSYILIICFFSQSHLMVSLSLSLTIFCFSFFVSFVVWILFRCQWLLLFCRCLSLSNVLLDIYNVLFFIYLYFSFFSFSKWMRIASVCFCHLNNI